MTAKDDRARGALLGLAIGDALGTSNEFKRTDAPPFPTKATGPQREIIGGGPFSVQPGQVTDDTHMAICLASSLATHGGVLDVDDVAMQYVEWSRHAFDIGAQTSAALRAVASGTSARDAGREVWLARGRSAAGNGSLMRTAPIAVLATTPAERRRASLDDSAITHFDPRCQIACAAFNAAIGESLAMRDVGNMFDAARADIAATSLQLQTQWPEYSDEVRAAASSLGADLDRATADDPELYGSELHLHAHQGFVRVAFRLAFWELAHASSFPGALLDVINRGGDSDTNGAITGALLGARFGGEALPRRWVEAVLEAMPENPRDSLTTAYHPRRLLSLVASH